MRPDQMPGNSMRDGAITFERDCGLTYILRSGSYVAMIYRDRKTGVQKLSAIKGGESNWLIASELRAIAAKLDELNKEGET